MSCTSKNVQKRIRQQPLCQGIRDSVFYRKKLKFHVPKNDVCGLCDTFNRGNKDERDKIKETYEKHIAEKQAVRKVNEVLKSTVIDWTNFMVIQLSKESPNKIFFKDSHLTTSFSSSNLDSNRRRSNPEENLSIIETPKISNVKFDDLMTFCDGNSPVIFHPEHKAFYQMLLH